MFQAEVIEKIKTHILWSVTFFPPRKSCRLWDNVEKYGRAGRPQMTIWRMRIACWITKATDTNSCNNGSTKVTHCYITRTLPVLFYGSNCQYFYLVPSIPLCWRLLSVSMAVKHNIVLLNPITGCLYWLTTCFGQLHDHHQVYKS